MQLLPIFDQAQIYADQSLPDYAHGIADGSMSSWMSCIQTARFDLAIGRRNLVNFPFNQVPNLGR